MIKRTQLVKKVVSVVCSIVAIVSMSPIGTVQAKAQEIDAQEQYQLVAELCQQDQYSELTVGDYVCAVGDLKDAAGNIMDASEWEFCSYADMKDVFDEMGVPLCYYSAYDDKDRSYVYNT